MQLHSEFTWQTVASMWAARLSDRITLQMCQAFDQKACLKSDIHLDPLRNKCQDKSTLAYSCPPALSEACVVLGPKQGIAHTSARSSGMQRLHLLHS